MDIVSGAGKRTHAEACGRISHDAFCAISAAHNFPPDFPSPEVSIGVDRFLNVARGARCSQPMLAAARDLLRPGIVRLATG